MVIPMAWLAMGCADGAIGDGGEDGRDLTTMTAGVSESVVASDLELGRTPVAAEAPFAAAPVESLDAPGEAESDDAERTEPAPALVSFTDGLDLASEPQIIETALPILGAGAGTMLRPGATVVAVGNPVDLFRPVRSGASPWPEARPGEFPVADRYGTTLAVGSGGGGGHCPMPGLISR
jgi:hypothetical protein